MMDEENQNLMIYTEAGSALLHENFHRLPMILSGDFNVDFSKDTSKPLVDFLISTFNLNMLNDPNERMTKYRTTIDGSMMMQMKGTQSKIHWIHCKKHKKNYLLNKTCLNIYFVFIGVGRIRLQPQSNPTGLTIPSSSNPLITLHIASDSVDMRGG
ncbi:Uncharacterized protein FWK35_00000089 [Aphis craccivora]|uniref:Endonuclease/exonuclease/phosphatase domain-containing protein n=1 Tax=Aphis craccivora TaxID=307492 RepID=A0A6G0ZP52_APHCR|nr:Uncharacterized protein FWK35_00000089 [Aphis craccivora]